LTTLRFAVGTIIDPIRVRVASEVIIAASAAEMESKVGGGFEILEDSLGCGEMAGGRMELYRQSAAIANEISGRVASAAYINQPTIAW